MSTYASDPETCDVCMGIVPPEGTSMVPDDGELCSCTENGVEAIGLSEVVHHYTVALRWSETNHQLDEDGEVWIDQPFDAIDAELTEDAKAEIRKDVNAFLLGNQRDIHAYTEALGLPQVGHDFALTRNGHGAGFWDRGLGELGQRLSDASKPYGEQHLILGDDGNVHVM
jgi:hypothetical protein